MHDNPFGKLCKWGVILWSLLCFFGMCVGLANVGSQIERFDTELEREAAGLGATLGIGVWFFVWIIPTFGGVILYFMFGRSSKILAAFLPIFAVSLTAPIEAYAGTVRKDAPFCTEKAELIALARATVARDIARMMELVSGDGTCMVLSSRTRATLVSKHDGGNIVEVRLLKGGATLEGFAIAKDFVE